MNVLKFDSEANWLAGLVSLWRDRLRVNGALRHCLASGNTPIPIYRQMAQAVQKKQVSFARATIFALDEFGGLAPDDPGLCRNMLERDLIQHVDLPKQNFHSLNPDSKDLGKECAAYDAAIGTGFDLVVLGIGTNGHLGMNEPGSRPDSITRKVELHQSTISASARYLTHQNLPTWGLTVGMKQFLNSAEVWLVATGKGKAQIIGQVVKGQISQAVPATLMRYHTNCSLFVDAAAGAQV